MDNENEIKIEKKQNNLLKIIAGMIGVIMAVVLISAILVVPKAIRIMNQADTIMASAQDAIDKMNVVADELNEADLPGLVDDTKTLVSTSSEGVEEAMDKISNIKFDELNEAIEDLQAVVEPLAKIMGK